MVEKKKDIPENLLQLFFATRFAKACGFDLPQVTKSKESHTNRLLFIKSCMNVPIQEFPVVPLLSAIRTAENRTGRVTNPAAGTIGEIVKSLVKKVQ